MVLSLRQLELLRKKCAAEEVAIDLDLMADWTAQQAMEFFNNGGKLPDPDAPEPVKVERMAETEVPDHAYEQGVGQKGKEVFTNDEDGALREIEEEVPAGIAYAQKYNTLEPTMQLELNTPEADEWRKAYNRRLTGKVDPSNRLKMAGQGSDSSEDEDDEDDASSSGSYHYEGETDDDDDDYEGKVQEVD